VYVAAAQLAVAAYTTAVGRPTAVWQPSELQLQVLVYRTPWLGHQLQKSFDESVKAKPASVYDLAW